MYTSTDLHRRYTVMLAALLWVGVGVPYAQAQIGLGLTPMRLEMPIAAGAQASGVLNVSNDSSSDVRVRADLLDFYIDPAGTPQFAADRPEEAEQSCRTWLSLNPMETELGPGEQIQVRYTLRVPEGKSAGSYHCAAGFTTLPTQENIQSTGLRTAVRIIAAFYSIVGTPQPNGSVQEMRLERSENAGQSGWQGVVTMENAGSSYFRAAGELSVLDGDGQLVESVPFRGIPVLPQREQQFLFPLKQSLPPGRYVLRSRVDIGANAIQEATAPAVVEATAE